MDIELIHQAVLISIRTRITAFCVGLQEEGEEGNQLFLVLLAQEKQHQLTTPSQDNDAFA